MSQKEILYDPNNHTLCQDLQATIKEMPECPHIFDLAFGKLYVCGVSDIRQRPEKVSGVFLLVVPTQTRFQKGLSAARNSNSESKWQVNNIPSSADCGFKWFGLFLLSFLYTISALVIQGE